MTTFSSTNNDGKLKDPRGKPFEIVFSKEHPDEKRAHGFEDDLLLPLAKKLDCVCYKYLFFGASEYGVEVPCPKAPLFANCDILFREMADPSCETYSLYRDFVDWWSDVLARCLLSGAAEAGIHFNLAGYTKERIEVIRARYQQLLSEEKTQRIIKYGFLDNKPYLIAPHIHFNTVWTAEEKKKFGGGEDELYPGFTDWDIAFILNDKKVLEKTTFYNIPNVKHLEDIKPVSNEELAKIWGIEKEDTQNP